MARESALVRILRHGADIVHEKGFNNTGVQEVLDGAGVPKGSFYYYFRSKEDLGLQLIDYYSGLLFARMEDSLGRADLTPLEGLKSFFEGYRASFEKNGFRGGCPIGNLAQEMADLSPAFREKLEGVFRQFRDNVQQCLLEARKRGELSPALDAGVAADFIVNTWEGAVTRMKAAKDAQPLLVFERTVFGMLLR